MMTFAQFQKLQEDKLLLAKKIAPMVPPLMSIGARHKAAVAKWHGDYKRAAQLASQRLIQKAKKAETYPVPETDQPVGDK